MKRSEDIERLCRKIQSMVYKDMKETTYFIPYNQANIVSYFNEQYIVKKQENCEKGIKIIVEATKKDRDKFKKYIISVN